MNIFQINISFEPSLLSSCLGYFFHIGNVFRLILYYPSPLDMTPMSSLFTPFIWKAFTLPRNEWGLKTIAIKILSTHFPWFVWFSILNFFFIYQEGISPVFQLTNCQVLLDLQRLFFDWRTIFSEKKQTRWEKNGPCCNRHCLIWLSGAGYKSSSFFVVVEITSLETS